MTTTSSFGADPSGWWGTSRRAALARLRAFVDHGLPAFGPHEDAMPQVCAPNDGNAWRLAHSALSHALNVGLRGCPTFPAVRARC